MTYPIEETGNMLIIRLTGEIDLENASHLRESLLNALDRGRSLLVEMSDVGYIDSSGIASLVEALQNARNKSLDLKLVSPSARVRRVLELARLDKVFSIHTDVGSATQ
jgi:anti-sigma B factor antagonist